MKFLGCCFERTIWKGDLVEKNVVVLDFFPLKFYIILYFAEVVFLFASRFFVRFLIWLLSYTFQVAYVDTFVYISSRLMCILSYTFQIACVDTFRIHFKSLNV